ncbi:MAG: DUF2079 domain-containing protein [Cryobacterium sp.]|nr:DUF2079 domain-containing protein [Oligoflexia bacterium]
MKSASSAVASFLIGGASVIYLTAGFSLPSVHLRSLTSISLLLAAVMVFRKLSGLSVAGSGLFARLGYRVSNRPSLVTALLLLPILIVTTFRPLVLGAAFEDAGYVNQGMYQFFGKPWLHCDVCVANSFLGEHQSYTLFFGWLWLKVFSTPYSVPVFAAVLIAIFFKTLLRTFSKNLPPYALSFLVLAVFLVRGFHGGFLYDFREDLLGAVFFGFMIAAVLKERWALGAVAFALAILSKETCALIAPALLPLVFVQLQMENGSEGSPIISTEVSAKLSVRDGGKSRQLGFLALYLGVALTGAYLSLVRGIHAWNPNPNAPSMIAVRLGHLGSTLPEILKTAVLHPFQIFPYSGESSATGSLLRYLLHTLIPFLPLMVLAWNWAYFPGLIVLFGNLVSLAPSQRSMDFHYDLLVMPFFAYGLALSLARNKSGLSRGRLAAAILPFLILAGTSPLTNFYPHFKSRALILEARFMREESTKIPSSLPLMVDGVTYAQVVDRPELRLFPVGGRGLKPTDDASDAILRMSVYRANAGALSMWKKTACSPSGETCRFSKEL